MPGTQEPFKIEKIFINKNSNCQASGCIRGCVSENKIRMCEPTICVLVTCKNKFILYTGRLEVKFSDTMENPNEKITAGAFNKDSSILVIGTSEGRVISYRIESGEKEGAP